MKLIFSIVLLFGLLTGTFAQSVNESSKDTVSGTDDMVFPQELTAKELLLRCSASKLTFKGRLRQKYCSGFISGVEESVRLMSSLNKKTGVQTICLPQGKSAALYTDIYIQYALRKTTDLSKPSAMVVIEAFEESFPCTTEK